MAALITQTLAKPVENQIRPAQTPARPSSAARVESRTPATSRPAPRGQPEPTLQSKDTRRPAQPSARAPDRLDLQSRDAREIGRKIQGQGRAVSTLQSAGQKVESGVRDLQRLGQLARQSAEGDETTDRLGLNEEAKTLKGRLAKVDRDPEVQTARDTLRQDALERESKDARTEASPPEQAAEPSPPEAAAAEAGRAEPPQPEAKTAEAQPAEPPQREAEAEQAEPAEAGTTEHAPRVRQEAANGNREREATSLQAEPADVSTREAARLTVRAAQEAEVRATRFGEEIKRAEASASREAERTSTQAAQSGDARRLTTETDGRETADRIREAAQREPRRFVDAQARVSTEAAARLLA